MNDEIPFPSRINFPIEKLIDKIFLRKIQLFFI